MTVKDLLKSEIEGTYTELYPSNQRKRLAKMVEGTSDSSILSVYTTLAFSFKGVEMTASARQKMEKVLVGEESLEDITDSKCARIIRMCTITILRVMVVAHRKIATLEDVLSIIAKNLFVEYSEFSGVRVRKIMSYMKDLPPVSEYLICLNEFDTVSASTALGDILGCYEEVHEYVKNSNVEPLLLESIRRIAEKCKATSEEWERALDAAMRDKYVGNN